MMYLVSTSAAFLPEGPGEPGAWPIFPAILNGVMTGSSPHILWFSQVAVGGVAKPFCDTNQRSKPGPWIHISRSLAAFWFFEYFGIACEKWVCTANYSKNQKAAKD